MGRKLDYARVRRERRVKARSLTPIGRVARPPTAAEMLQPKPRPPVTLPRVKWLERPEP